MIENENTVISNTEINDIKVLLNEYIKKKLQISMLNEDIKDLINNYSEKLNINKKYLRKIANMMYKINCKKDRSIVEEEKNILSFVDMIMMEIK